MIKKTIKYIDYNGNERSEDYYFNLSRAELVMKEASRPGGMIAYYERIVKAQDNVALMDCFKDLIHESVGEKSDDGKRFIKSEEIATAFEQSEAYSELIVELFSSAEVALAFVNGIFPKDVADQLPKDVDKLTQFPTE